MSAPTSPQAGRRRGRVLLGALLAPVLGALFGGLVLLSAAPAEAASHQVRIQQYAYGPSGLSIEQGDTVTWTNLDTVAHDVYVTSGPESFHSPMLGKGESWSHTFSTAGSYSYICSVHPDMRASVSVTAAAPPPAATSAAPTSAAPTRATHAGSGHHDAAAPPAAPAATQAATATAPTVVPATTSSTLDPLLLVAGASVAVVVFCLLLMASRPVYEPTPAPVETAQAPRSTAEADAGHRGQDETTVDLTVGSAAGAVERNSAGTPQVRSGAAE